MSGQNNFLSTDWLKYVCLSNPSHMPISIHVWLKTKLFLYWWGKYHSLFSLMNCFHKLSKYSLKICERILIRFKWLKPKSRRTITDSIFSIMFPWEIHLPHSASVLVILFRAIVPIFLLFFFDRIIKSRFLLFLIFLF